MRLLAVLAAARSPTMPSRIMLDSFASANCCFACTERLGSQSRQLCGSSSGQDWRCTDGPTRGV